ncbi:unnamed protein product [Sphagnum balticum]
MCTHAASERARETARETREDRPVTNPIRISSRGIDNAQLPVVFGYQLHPDTNPRDLAREQRPVTNYVRYQTCSVGIEGKQRVRLPVTNPSDQGKRNAEGRAGGQGLPSSSS